MQARAAPLRPTRRGERLRVAGGAPPVRSTLRGRADRPLTRRAAAKSPEAPPPTWPPPKPTERRRAGEPLLWGTGLRKSHDGERVQFSGLDLTLDRGMKMAVVG